MARMSKAEKAIEKAFEDAFRVQGNCIQFNIMDLGKMRNETLGFAHPNMSQLQLYQLRCPITPSESEPC